MAISSKEVMDALKYETTIDRDIVSNFNGTTMSIELASKVSDLIKGILKQKYVNSGWKVSFDDIKQEAHGDEYYMAYIILEPVKE